MLFKGMTTKTSKVRGGIVGAALLLILCGAVFSQTQQTHPVKDEKNDAGADKSHAVDNFGPVVYDKSKRSPFEDPIRRPKKFGPPPSIRAFPSIEQRLEEYKAKRSQAKSVGAPLPSPLTAYLISELEVNGIFKTKEGYGAVVRARPTDTTLFVRDGDQAFNGGVVRIEQKQVIFKDATWMNHGPDQIVQVTKVIQAPSTNATATPVAESKSN